VIGTLFLLKGVIKVLIFFKFFLLILYIREAELMVMKERDEELALFLEMRRREKENEKSNLLLLQNTDELEFSNLGMFCVFLLFFEWFLLLCGN
jgi:hypothetical protein